MSSPHDAPVGLLIDITRCAGCHKCVAACMKRHGFEGDPDTVTKLSATACTSMIEKEIGDDDYTIRNLCRHCLVPTCVSVCPVAALTKTPEGPVIYDSERCIGCRYCILACPFDIPRYEWNKPVPSVVKCDMCVDRVREGKQPACAEACPYEATVFGKREDLLAEAHKRIKEDPDDYYDHVYGEHEIGGTSVLFLAPTPTDVFGYKESLGREPLPVLTMKQLDRLPAIVVGGSAALFAIWWITSRRDEVMAFEEKQRRETKKQGQNGRDRSHGHA